MASDWPIASEVMRMINAMTGESRLAYIVDGVVNHPTGTVCGMTCSEVDTGRPNLRCPSTGGGVEYRGKYFKKIWSLFLSFTTKTKIGGSVL